MSLRDDNPGGSPHEVNSSTIASPSADTWYWYRFTRNGLTCTCSRYTSEANRTTNTSALTMTTASLPSGWVDTDLINHFNFGGYSSHGADYDVRNIFLYRGATSI